MQNDQEERSNEITGGIASEISPGAELIFNNVDLLIEILLRLPAKSLIRFKCVSKHWLSLISHSQFASNHSIRNPRPSGLYFYLHNQLHSVSLCGGPNPPSLSFLDGFGEQSTTTILQSCNGLLLCLNAHYDGDIRILLLIVCNPTTKKHRIVHSSHTSESLSSGLAYLAFDPSKSPHYKVLLFNPLFSHQIDVYCSQSACWKHVTIHQIHQIHWDRGVFWNGAIHWFSGENSLVRFDANAEEMIVMPNSQTPKILTRDRTMYFGESGGSLILNQSTSRLSFKSEILELDKDYSSWIGKCHVNLNPLIVAFPEMKNRTFYILHIAKGDKERDFALVLAIPGRIISYDLKCKSWDVLRNLSTDEPIIFSLDHYASPFVETLFPI